MMLFATDESSIYLGHQELYEFMGIYGRNKSVAATLVEKMEEKKEVQDILTVLHQGGDHWIFIRMNGTSLNHSS